MENYYWYGLVGAAVKTAFYEEHLVAHSWHGSVWRENKIFTHKKKKECLIVA